MMEVMTGDKGGLDSDDYLGVMMTMKVVVAVLSVTMTMMSMS
jgi:hypothetical protein